MEGKEGGSVGCGERRVSARRQCGRKERVSAGAACTRACASRCGERRSGGNVRHSWQSECSGDSPRAREAVAVRVSHRHSTREGHSGTHSRRSLCGRQSLPRSSRLGGGARRQAQDGAETSAGISQWQRVERAIRPSRGSICTRPLAASCARFCFSEQRRRGCARRSGDDAMVGDVRTDRRCFGILMIPVRRSFQREREPRMARSSRPEVRGGNPDSS